MENQEWVARLQRPDVAEDHRVRVAAQRREKTRQRLLESALDVLQDKDPDSVVADDFIAAAGVSRGTFYNYFETTGDLIQALATAMNDETVAAINTYILSCKNPLERLAVGTRLYVRLANEYPVWGRFVTQVGVHVAGRGQPIEEYVTRDLTGAREAGLIQVRDVVLARDIVIGSIYHCIGTMVIEPVHDDYPELLAEALLRSMRVEESLLVRLAYGSLPPLGSISTPLFSRLKPRAARRD
jgi:AcrR family transcriptional regulator